MPKRGQVLVEMLLILPVFFAIIFGIMELGYIAFQTIVLNHATYEVARIGAMTRVSPYGTMMAGCDDLKGLMQRMLGPLSNVSCTAEQTGRDAQANYLPTYDLVVTGTNNVKLIFPISNLILATPLGSGRRLISAVLRMPIEQPLEY